MRLRSQRRQRGKYTACRRAEPVSEVTRAANQGGEPSEKELQQSSQMWRDGGRIRDGRDSTVSVRLCQH